MAGITTVKQIRESSFDIRATSRLNRLYVEKRIANVKLDPTFLMADVEVVATYELYNINRSKLENVLHKFFNPARLEIEIKDRFGNPVVPREWFLVPLFIIDEVVEKIKDKTISNYFYDTETVSLVSGSRDR